jgi:hypothetical protein
VRQAARPEEQNPAAERCGSVPYRVSEQPRPARRAERRRDTVDEHRHHRHHVDTAQQHLQGLRETVIDIHPLGQGHVDLGVQDGPGQRQGGVVVDGQGTGWRVVVANRLGRRPDTERRHHVVEEAVVVVRAEDHDQLGREIGDKGPRVIEGGLDTLARLAGGLGVTHKRRVRHRHEGRRHEYDSQNCAACDWHASISVDDRRRLARHQEVSRNSPETPR